MYDYGPSGELHYNHFDITPPSDLQNTHNHYDDGYWSDDGYYNEYEDSDSDNIRYIREDFYAIPINVSQSVDDHSYHQKIADQFSTYIQVNGHPEIFDTKSDVLTCVERTPFMNIKCDDFSSHLLHNNILSILEFLSLHSSINFVHTNRCNLKYLPLVWESRLIYFKYAKHYNMVILSDISELREALAVDHFRFIIKNAMSYTRAYICNEEDVIAKSKMAFRKRVSSYVQAKKLQYMK